MEKEVRAFAALGYQNESDMITDPLQRIHCRFLKGPGPRLELLTPMDDTSPLTPWLQKGVKMYHQAYEVVSIEDTVTRLQAQGAAVMSPPKPAQAFSGRRIAFLMLPNMLLIELIEAK
jgi:hypothetical protein